MNLTSNIAKHLREVHFGVNWTWSNLKDQLQDVTWEQAITKVYSLNTILALTYHIHYYVKVTTKVLEGGPLDGSDKFSFDHPAIKSKEDWDNFLTTVWAAAEKFANLIEQIPEEKLWETFSEEKYGIYYRNLHGIIEHSHYHLGQIAVIKKIVQEQQTT